MTANHGANLGVEHRGSTDEQIGESILFYEENYSGEYAQRHGPRMGLISALEEKVVVASTLYLPNGEQWIVYPENGPYEVGEIVSIEGVEGSWYTIWVAVKKTRLLLTCKQSDAKRFCLSLIKVPQLQKHTHISSTYRLSITQKASHS